MFVLIGFLGWDDSSIEDNSLSVKVTLISAEEEKVTTLWKACYMSRKRFENMARKNFVISTQQHL
jgi:hypothetical protein